MPMLRAGGRAARRVGGGGARTANSFPVPSHMGGVQAQAVRQRAAAAQARRRSNAPARNFVGGSARPSAPSLRPSPAGNNAARRALGMPSYNKTRAVRSGGMGARGPQATSQSVVKASQKRTLRQRAQRGVRNSTLWAGSGVVGLGVGFGMSNNPGATGSSSMYGSSGGRGVAY